MPTRALSNLAVARGCVLQRWATSSAVNGPAARLSKTSSLVAAMTVRDSMMPSQHSTTPGGSMPERRASRSMKLSATSPSRTVASLENQGNLSHFDFQHKMKRGERRGRREEADHRRPDFFSALSAPSAVQLVLDISLAKHLR